MSALTDYSDKPQYKIKSVSVQTGIRPVTLRAWERRYEILSPHRSDNRYRLYSDQDIAVLRWLNSRVQTGTAISAAVVELRQLLREGAPLESPTQPLPGSRRQPADAPEKYARLLYQVLVKHNEEGANNLVRQIQADYDLKTLTMGVFIPCLVEIGEAWVRGEIRITTEHFASAYLRGKLLTMLQSHPARRGAAYILVGGAPTEEHEIGALMMALLLRAEGYRTEFLGTDIPLDDLVDYARYEKPAMIILTATTRQAALELMGLQNKLRRLRSAPLFGFGGFAFNYEPDLRQKIPGIFLGESLDNALAKVGELLNSPKGQQGAGPRMMKSARKKIE